MSILLIDLGWAERRNTKSANETTPTKNPKRRSRSRPRKRPKPRRRRRNSSPSRRRKFRTARVLRRRFSLQLSLRTLQIRKGSARVRGLFVQVGPGEGQQVSPRLQTRATRTAEAEEGRKGGSQGRGGVERSEGEVVSARQIHRNRHEESRQKEFRHNCVGAQQLR